MPDPDACISHEEAGKLKLFAEGLHAGLLVDSHTDKNHGGLAVVSMCGRRFIGRRFVKTEADVLELAALPEL